ncbi:hypothetical protein AB0I53_09190 [Saccharopolyspora sp. NPDC050389]|uniref:hypothetical protein n=1 Tax=Saccharopolyspora sp. NPDC050389 TaxID=3155516 RepID=UPI0033F862BC
MLSRRTYAMRVCGAVQPPVVFVPGMPDADAMAGHYSRCSGADLSDLDYYVAFALWKGACILQGVYSRIRAGAMAGQEQDVELVHQLVRERAGLAVALLRRN